MRLLKITGGRPGSGEQLNQVSFDGASVVVHPKAPPKKLGAATLYLNGSRDAANALLDGGKSYHLFAPAQRPAKQFGRPFTMRRRRPSSVTRPMSKSILIKTRRRTPTGRQMFSSGRGLLQRLDKAFFFSYALSVGAMARFASPSYEWLLSAQAA